MSRIPNFLTLAQVALGFLQISAVLDGRLWAVPPLVCAALLADGLAGRVARSRNLHSDLGAELDALAVLMAFGIGPLVYAFEANLRVLGAWGWLVAVAGAVSCALRLSRDNASSPDWPLYQGLPGGAFGAVLALTTSLNPPAPLLALLLLLLAAGMLSPWRWRRLDGGTGFWMFLGGLTLLGAFLTWPRGLLLALLVFYVAGGAFADFGGLLGAPEKPGRRR